MGIAGRCRPRGRYCTALPLLLSCIVFQWMGSAFLWAREPALREGQTVGLDLPEANPESFRLRLVANAEAMELSLWRHSLRADDFRVSISDAGGNLTLMPPPPVSTYRGEVLGDPGSVVVARFDGETLRLTLRTSAGDSWDLESSGSGEGILRKALDPAEQAHGDSVGCGGGLAVPIEAASPIDASPVKANVSDPNKLESCSLSLAEVAFDVDFDTYQALGSSVARSVAQVEHMLNQVDFFYARDVLITHQITEIIVRAEKVYFTRAQNRLTELQSRWLAQHTDIRRDLVHLLFNGAHDGFGGFAWVGTVCHPQFGFGWSSYDNPNAFGHELGHNWGGNHHEDQVPPNECNSMCGGCFLWLANSKRAIESHRDGLTCLDEAPAYSQQLPPYAMPDQKRARVSGAGVQAAVGVLRNDHDANCEPLQIQAFDRTTPGGGTVEQEGSRLRYRLGTQLAGEDRFSYTVSDSNGNEAVGEVVILEARDCPWPPGHGRYCRDCGPCAVEQGDCDGDGQCAAGLRCAKDVGDQYGYGPNIDVCLPGGSAPPSTCSLPLGHGRFCSSCGPCSSGEGDCDSDTDCAPGLSCANNVGAEYGFSPNVDVCVQ